MRIVEVVDAETPSLENGKITGNTAFSIINNNAMFVEPNEQRVSPIWLARNDDGIWFINEKSSPIEKIDHDGNKYEKWETQYLTPYLLEDKNGNLLVGSPDGNVVINLNEYRLIPGKLIVEGDLEIKGSAEFESSGVIVNGNL